MPMIPQSWVPERKVTTGLMAQVLLYMALKVIAHFSGKPMELTVDEVQLFTMGFVFVLQYFVKNPEQTSATAQSQPPHTTP